MKIDLSEKKYKINIDGKWDLEDLYVFPHTYEQVYFLLYSLLPHDDEEIQSKIKYAYSKFPWKGGYSAVNFYNKLKYTTPRQERPRVVSIQYASPGWFELSLIISVAFAVEKLVKSIASTIDSANATYHAIHKGMSERELLRIEVQNKALNLEKEHSAYIKISTQEMSNLLGLKDVEQMNEKSGSSLKTLKILLSLYRRVRDLAKFQNNGKTKL